MQIYYALLLYRLTRLDRRGLLDAVTVLLILWGTSLSAQPVVQVQWDANPETNISGYRIYYGQTGGLTTNVMDVGNQTSGMVTNLNFSTSYFFYVTAYNFFNLESDPSQILYYTTRVFQPLSISSDGYIAALAPSVVTLHAARLQGDLQPGSSLLINWQQGAGATTLPIANGNTLTPTVTLDTPGFYTLSVSVADGTSFLQTSINLEVYNAQPSTGVAPLALEPPMLLPDGLALSWNSLPGHTYSLGVKRDLNYKYWALVALNVSSQGTTTYWVSDSALATLGQGFVTVFDLGTNNSGL